MSDEPLPWMAIPDEAKRMVQAALDRLGIQTQLPIKVSPYQPIRIHIDARPLLDAIAGEVIAQAGRHGDAIDGYVTVSVGADPASHRQTIVNKPRRRSGR